MTVEGVRVVGLTGGIASGKSTVSAMFRALGAHVIDADELAREVVRPGAPALLEIERRFPGVVLPDGSLDRAALARRVFSDAGERAALNALIHPRIQEAMAARTTALAASGVDLVLYDAALLIENGLDKLMDGVVLVAVPEEEQLRRLMARDRLSGDEARARLSAQAPLEEKKRHSTWVVDNSQGLSNTRAQVEAIWAELRKGSSGKVRRP